MSDLVGNPEDQFSYDMAQLNFKSQPRNLKVLENEMKVCDKLYLSRTNPCAGVV